MLLILQCQLMLPLGLTEGTEAGNGVHLENTKGSVLFAAKLLS